MPLICYCGPIKDYTEEGHTITVGVFDMGGADGVHPEFLAGSESRVRHGDASGNAIEPHATAVASIIAARGAKPAAKGIAPRVVIESFDYKGALTELEEKAAGLQVANFSYTPPVGWLDWNDQWFWYGNTAMSPIEDSNFGKYSANNGRFDGILARSPHLVAVVAAGNHRDTRPPKNNGQFQPPKEVLEGLQPHMIRDPLGPKDQWNKSHEKRLPHTADGGGFDTIVGLGLSKNCICVGAVHNRPRTVPPGATQQGAAFSSWGPPDDHRIKPDLVGAGVNQEVAWDLSTKPYGNVEGTSFACPNAAGICALLNEIYTKRHGQPPTADLMKAVLISTATDVGAPGPDPCHGWGLIDAMAAAWLIDAFDGEVIERREISDGDEYTATLGTTGRPIRVTLVWADPAALENKGGLDDSTATLVHDLDAELVSPSGKRYWPWRLDHRNPRGPALQMRPDDTVKEGNHVDNVEVIDAPHEHGDWTIRVRFARLDGSRKQPFALVTQGLKRGAARSAPAALGSVRIASTEPQLAHRLNRFYEEFRGSTEFGRSVSVALFIGQALSTHREFRGLGNTTRVRGRGRGGDGLDDRTNEQVLMDSYSTAMAGLVAARGENPRSQGVAPLASLESYKIRIADGTLEDDLDELDRIAPNVQVSLHPYKDLEKRGHYTDRHRRLDQILAKADRHNLLVVSSAGNEGDNAQSVIGLGLAKNALCIGAVEGVMSESDSSEAGSERSLILSLEGVEFDRTPEVDYAVYLGLPQEVKPEPDGPYYVGNLTSPGLKNPPGSGGHTMRFAVPDLVLKKIQDRHPSTSDLRVTIVPRTGTESVPGKADAVPEQLERGSVKFTAVRFLGRKYVYQAATYSSRGPTADGRIKPDLVALGDRVSTTDEEQGKESYVVLSGTGPASAVAAGICGVLIEQFKMTIKRAPLSDEIRAVLIHSAKDLGPHGPDSRYGWGVIDAYAAGQIIHDRGGDVKPEDKVHGGHRGDVAEGGVIEYRYRKSPLHRAAPSRSRSPGSIPPVTKSRPREMGSSRTISTWNWSRQTVRRVIRTA